MNYYYDTEFLEGTQKKWFGRTKPTIDLISIGIISEDNREYYAISKDFNLKEAWNRYDEKIEQVSGDMRNHFPNGITKKVYWIRENVLKPIFQELLYSGYKKAKLPIPDVNEKQFTYKNLKKLIQSFGKTNKQIAQDVFEFISQDEITIDKAKFYNKSYEDIELYGYYSAYDHVALCWLFGKMIDLPKGFPMYSKDLKQILDEKVSVFCAKEIQDTSFESAVKRIKMHKDYPKQTNEHNALADARWNMKLHRFLRTL